MKPKWRTKHQGIKGLKRDLDTTFAKYIRLRDRDLPCISCGQPCGTGEAGHYYARKVTIIRFDERNVNKQCHYCNHTLEGNRPGYMRGIIAKWGEDALNELEANFEYWSSGKWPCYKRWDYEEMYFTYKDKLEKL